MKRLTFAVIFSLLLITGCKTAEPTKSTTTTKPEPTAQVESLQGSEKRISFEGVSLTYDSNLFSEAKPEIVPAQPLENESDKPDGYGPRNIRFLFKGDYAENHIRASYIPNVTVYSVEEYKEAFSVSKQYVEDIEKTIGDLKTLINQQPVSWKGDIPYVPFIDATQAFQVHIKHADFQNGKGIFFLTQYDIEPSLVSNEGLTYIFQGLTEDGKYYVLAEFRVGTSILPDNDTAESHDGYTLPAYFYSGNAEANQKAYDAYVARVAGKLEKLPPDKFTPDLTVFEKLVRSIRVEEK